MKFTLESANADYVFGHYGDGKLTVNETAYNTSLIIFPDKLTTDWPVNSLEELDISHFQEIIDRQPDIALLGTGATQKFPAPPLRRALIDAGLNLEVMDTAAACRTYNLLVSEGRDVAAAVIIF